MPNSKWRRAHPWQTATQNFDFNSRRRMASRGLLANYIERVDVLLIYQAQRGCCRSCDREVTLYAGDKTDRRLAHFDHRYPLCWGGLHTAANVQMLCQQCHIGKSKIKYRNQPLAMAA